MNRHGGFKGIPEERFEVREPMFEGETFGDLAVKEAKRACKKTVRGISRKARIDSEVKKGIPSEVEMVVERLSPVHANALRMPILPRFKWEIVAQVNQFIEGAKTVLMATTLSRKGDIDGGTMMRELTQLVNQVVGFVAEEAYGQLMALTNHGQHSGNTPENTFNEHELVGTGKGNN